MSAFQSAMSQRQCLATASFLEQDPRDREELARDLMNAQVMSLHLLRPSAHYSHMSASHALGGGSVSGFTTDDESSDAGSDIHHNIRSSSPNAWGLDASSTATVHQIASFLLNNDTDRQELVTVLRTNMGKSHWDSPMSPSSARESFADVHHSSGGKAVYGVEENELFNELVLIETPALSTAPVETKL
ncbi:hypothetical protein HK101_003407 [Irineochytrium annulatum]|nr:hypothetical protein HK101_003407 [Irineochytrium annulatum]